MKTLKKLHPVLVIFLFICSNFAGFAQDTTNVSDQQKRTFIVTKNDGTEYVGVLISQDEREVLLETKSIGRLYIPKHEIKSIHELTADDIKAGTIPGNNVFSTRYFLTTNGLRMKKGDSYAIMHYYGPEIQFSVSDGLTVGAMTTWVAMPIVLSAKTSFSANENLHFGIGLLAGTLSWANWGTIGALPYGSVTYGNSRNNISLSGGYAIVTGDNVSGSAPLFSVGCLVRITDKVSFVGDSFLYFGNETFSIFVPGIRVSKRADRAFQIGFAAVSSGGDMAPVPIPIVSWFIKI